MIKDLEVMWIIATFDMPVKTKLQIKRYSAFRKKLMSAGYEKFQFSVYIRHFPTLRSAQASILKLSKQIPPNGKVCFFHITDKQFGMAKNFYGMYLQEEDLPTKYEEQGILFDNNELHEFEYHDIEQQQNIQVIEEIESTKDNEKTTSPTDSPNVDPYEKILQEKNKLKKNPKKKSSKTKNNDQDQGLLF